MLYGVFCNSCQLQPRLFWGFGGVLTGKCVNKTITGVEQSLNLAMSDLCIKLGMAHSHSLEKID